MSVMSPKEDKYPLPDSLRPPEWDDFLGHTDQRDALRDALDAARREGRLPPHALLWGLPGTGKTSLARLVLNGVGKGQVIFCARLNDYQLVAALRETHSGVLVLDELHMLPKAAQHILLPVLEHGELHWGGERRQLYVCVLGCTTERHRVLPTLRDRFLIDLYFGPYSTEEIAAILERTARRIAITLSPTVAQALASHSRGIPRLALRLLLRARDRAAGEALSPAAIEQALHDLGYTDGLLREEVRYLLALARSQGRASYETLRLTLGLSRDELSGIESYLLNAGLIFISPSGRTLTLSGWEKAGELIATKGGK